MINKNKLAGMYFVVHSEVIDEFQIKKLTINFNREMEQKKGIWNYWAGDIAQ